MTLERYLQKLRAYWRWWREGKYERFFNFGGYDKKAGFRVLTVTKSEDRAKNLCRIAKEADDAKRGSRMFWFTCEKNYSLENPGSILGPIWRTPVDDSLHHILE